MNNTELNSNSYHDAWLFVEEYLPNYDHRNDVLYDDILFRFLDDEYVSEKDIEWIRTDFNCDKKRIKEELIRIESSFMAEALQAYFETNM